MRQTVSQAKIAGQIFQWDVWNEPDISNFWPRTEDQWNETWRRRVLQIRAADPTAIVVGPSLSHAGARLQRFLLYAKANNVLPDVISWHELDPNTVRQIPQTVGSVRAFLRANGISINRVELNEIEHGTVVATLTKIYGPTFFQQGSAADFIALVGDESITISIDSGSAIVCGATADDITQDPSLQIARRAS